jgi:hypothetical protein
MQLSQCQARVLLGRRHGPPRGVEHADHVGETGHRGVVAQKTTAVHRRRPQRAGESRSRCDAALPVGRVRSFGWPFEGTETFRPSARASSTEVRKHGAITFGVGVVLIAASGLLVLGLGRWVRQAMPLLMVPSLAAYPMFGFGGYRMMMGADPADAGDSSMASLQRIGIAVVSLVLGGVVSIGLMVGSGYALGME